MNRSSHPNGAPLPFPTGSRPASLVEAAAVGRCGDSVEQTVLVVDDQHVVLELIDAFLEDSEYRVYLAGGGRQALEMCQRIGPALDLLLTDVRMPGMDGPELYEMVVERHPRVRVLFMSGFQAAEAVRFGVPAHAPLLVKPFKPAELLERIRQVLTGPARLGGLVARL